MNHAYAPFDQPPMQRKGSTNAPDFGFPELMLQPEDGESIANMAKVGHARRSQAEKVATVNTILMITDRIWRLFARSL
ncbi:MAG TPA: hypothetical protein VGY66_27810 [Gemmataceae bacterium]|jgi:hypothetical protein|nr:hypothetical protein [Gemmataceae bacterium]